MDNNNLPLALFCDRDGFEVTLTADGLSVKTNTSSEYFCLADMTSLQLIADPVKYAVGNNEHKKLAGTPLGLPGIVLITGLICLVAGIEWHNPILASGGFVLLVTGSLLLARLRSREQNVAPLCYLHIELKNTCRDYPFEGNLIKRLDMSVLEAHFKQLKTRPGTMVNAD